MNKIVFFFFNWIPSVLTFGFMFVVWKYFHSQYLIFILLFYIYLLPVLFYRIFYFAFPKEYGKCDLFSAKYNQWWFGIQVQAIYNRFSVFEEFLRLFPFVYSFWLSLWGGKIGKFIFWSPKVLIVDRGDLTIGDYCVVGYGVKMTSHLLSKSHKRNVLIYYPIEIEDKSYIGADVNIGPGVKIKSDVVIAALSTLLPFSEWKNSKEYTPREN